MKFGISRQQVLQIGERVVATFVVAFLSALGLGVAGEWTAATLDKAWISGVAAAVALVQSLLSQWLTGQPTVTASLGHGVKALLVRRRPPAVNLGKLPAREDPRTLPFARYLPAARTQLRIPKRLDWSAKVRGWGMMLNDRIGDCTCAGVGHAIQLMTANASTQVTLPDRVILKAYERLSGYNPVTGQNDTGCIELDVLNYWRTHGVGGHRIAAYTKVDRLNLQHVRAAIDLFGFAYIGTAVPKAWTRMPNVWDLIAGPDGQIVGGHCVIYVGYDETGFDLVSWGRRFRITVAAHERYVDEVWAVVSRDWISADGRSPSGFDTRQLLADLATIH